MQPGTFIFLSVPYSNRFLTYRVCLKSETRRNQVFQVITKRRAVTFTNDWPNLLKHGLKKRKPTWVLSERFNYRSLQENIIAEIEKNILN